MVASRRVGDSNPIVVYGLSTEGYQIASSLATNHTPTILVDERLQVATEVTPETVSTYSSARELIEEESLLGIRPIDVTISETDAVFFTPKIRRPGDEAKKEWSSMLSSISKNISKGTIIFSCLPVGFGINSEMIEIVERASGLQAWEEFTYVYLPLLPRTRSAITFGMEKNDLVEKAKEILRLAQIKHPKNLTLLLSEINYLREIMGNYPQRVIELEVYKSVRDFKLRRELSKSTKADVPYLDVLADGLHDIKNIVSSLQSGEPSLYIASGVLRGIEGYTRFLTDELKALMKEKELKASRTDVTLGWNLDRFEIRGEKILLRELLIERIGDLVGDVGSPIGVEYGASSEKVARMPSLGGDKIHLLIICSKSDEDLLTGLDSRTLRGIVTLKANLICDRS